MMLVVFAVTSATLYLAGKNLRAKQQEKLETQFQNEVRSYLALQESRLSGINEKCKAFSHSVRIRAALEERDIDDLYRNALTELRDVLGPSDDSPNFQRNIRASFVRFLDPAGAVLPPDGQPIRMVDQSGVDPALEAAGAALRGDDQQSSGLIALNSERQLSALRQIVVTKIVDWNGAELGAIVLGFPVQALQVGDEDPKSFRAGIFFNRGIYVTGMSPFDRALLTKRMNASIGRYQSTNFEVELESGPQLLFYKALDPTTRLHPAYAVCLFPWLMPCMKFRPYAGRSLLSGPAFSAPDSLLAFFSLEDWPSRWIKLSLVRSKILPAARKRKKISSPLIRSWKKR